MLGGSHEHECSGAATGEQVRAASQRSRRLAGVLLTSFPAGPLQANCYVIAAFDGGPCAVVDPGMESFDTLRRLVDERGFTVEAVLLTHGHFDHMWCAQDVAAQYGCAVWIHPADRHLLSDPMAALSGSSAAALRQQLAAVDLPEFVEPADVRDAVDGARIEVDAITLTVDHCPGHTAGTVMYRTDYPGPEPVSQLVFSGDFLFCGSIGRTDLGGGDHDVMLESLRDKVLTLPDDVVVLPGHGQQTSIGTEKKTNPFLAELTR